MHDQTYLTKLSEDPRFEGAKLVKEWSTWMVTTEGVIIGFLINSIAKWPPSGSEVELPLNRNLIVGTIAAFALSMAVAAWVVGSLPSVVQRLPHSRRALGAHGMLDLPWLRDVPLYVLTFLQHLFFGVGIVTLLLALPWPLPSKFRLAPSLGFAFALVAGAIIVRLSLKRWRRHVRSGKADYSFESIYHLQDSSRGAKRTV